MQVILFNMLLFGSCGYALLRGSADTRVVAVVCVVATFASYGLVSHYKSVEVGVLIVDLVTFLAFTFVAMISDRFWPLWVSGLQLTTILGHLLKGVESNLLPTAYAAALHFWSYPILIILAVAAWRSQGRSAREARATAV
jgi:hypothetical protein